MPVVLFTSAFVKAPPPCPDNRRRVDFFDTRMQGLVLEVRRSGGATYHVRYYDMAGRIRQMKIGCTSLISLTQARQKAREWRARVALGDDPLVERRARRCVLTLDAFVRDHYLPYAKAHKRSWKTDETLLRVRIQPRWGNLPMDAITRTELVDFHNELRAQGLCAATANRHLVLLRFVFNQAIRWGHFPVGKSPLAGFEFFAENNHRERYLSQSETTFLHRALCDSQNPMLRYIIPMLILTGARKREVLDARWEDVDLARREWRIPHTKAGVPRHVPLSDGVLQLLASMPHDECPWIFANPKTRRPYVSFFCSWNTARKAADLAEVRIHDLRHSFASFLINAGRSLYEVQKILGHTQIKTTQRYAHLSQETLIDAANAAVSAVGDAFSYQVLDGRQLAMA
ncbi:MAG: hypothetical protein RIR18_333 [Pseudomonadota bacterium]|jgi:integrase